MVVNVSGMNTIAKTYMTLEHHCLEQPYGSLRLQRRYSLNKLILSFETHGQLMPVIVIPHALPNHWVLIDGYLRVDASRRIGHDKIKAEVWDCDAIHALLRILTEHQSHQWTVLEEALLLRELHTAHGVSQSCLANKIGRDKSWVCRRLSLLAQLPDAMLALILQEKISLWVATRIIEPLARANSEHGQCLLNYLIGHHRKSRELQLFYNHYQRSNSVGRAHMIEHPDLFFKSHELLMAEHSASLLKAGPEGEWRRQLKIIQKALIQLMPLPEYLFAHYQDAAHQAKYVTLLNSVKTQFDLFTESVKRLTYAH